MNEQKVAERTATMIHTMHVFLRLRFNKITFSYQPHFTMETLTLQHVLSVIDTEQIQFLTASYQPCDLYLNVLLPAAQPVLFVSLLLEFML